MGKKGKNKSGPPASSTRQGPTPRLMLEHEGSHLRFVGVVDPNVHDLSSHRVSGFDYPYFLLRFRFLRNRIGRGGVGLLGTGSGFAEAVDFAARAVGASIVFSGKDLFDGEHGPILLLKG